MFVGILLTIFVCIYVPIRISYWGITEIETSLASIVDLVVIIVMFFIYLHLSCSYDEIMPLRKTKQREHET